MKKAELGDWKIEAMPEKRATITLDRVYSEKEMELIRQGVVPEEMEDKWFIFWQDDALHFHRSWNGHCLFIVRFAKEDKGWRMVEAEVNRDPEQYRETNDDNDAKLIPYLIDILLLGRPAEFPLNGSSAEDRAAMTWSMIGRAMFGAKPMTTKRNPE